MTLNKAFTITGWISCRFVKGCGAAKENEEENETKREAAPGLVPPPRVGARSYNYRSKPTQKEIITLPEVARTYINVTRMRRTNNGH